MPFKDPTKRREYNRKYQADWYRRNRRRHLRYVQKVKARYRREIREWVIALKGAWKCEHCSENHPACLEFHHRNPKTKKFGIANLTRLGVSKAKIRAEIAKCQILCANCHRKLHWEMRQLRSGAGGSSEVS